MAEQQQQQISFKAELAAMAREAVKDVREKVMEAGFGQREGPGEPGTPLNPTPQIVTNDLTRGRLSLSDMAGQDGKWQQQEQQRQQERGGMER